MKLKDLNKDFVYYVASPYSALDPKTEEDRIRIQRERYNEVTKVIAKLTKDHELVLLGPITHSHNLKLFEADLGTSWQFWKRYDTKFLERCVDAVIVVMMHDWDLSIGVDAEIVIAEKLGLPIYYLNPNTMELNSVSTKLGEI